MRNSLKAMKTCTNNRLILSRTLYNPYRDNNFNKFARRRRNLPLRAMYKMRYNHLIKSGDHIRLMLRAKLEKEEDILNLNAYKKSGI